MKTRKNMSVEQQRRSMSSDIKSIAPWKSPSVDLRHRPLKNIKCAAGTQYQIDSACIDMRPSIPGASQELGQAYLTIAVDTYTKRIVHAVIDFGAEHQVPATSRPGYYRPQIQSATERAFCRLLRPSSPN